MEHEVAVMFLDFQRTDIDVGNRGADPIAEFFARSAEDRYCGWDLFANVAHWASVSAGVALMVVAGLDYF
jgi:hypothetical protein